MAEDKHIEEIRTGFSALTEMVKGLFKTKLKFAEVMTSDGKVLSYEGDQLMEGTPVMVDGAPAPDGAYTLEDGTVCNVKEGKVESIVQKQQEMNAEEFNTQFKAMEDRIAAFEAKFEENTNGFATQFENIGKALTALTEQMGKQVELVGKFAAQAPAPAEPPTNRTSTRLSMEAERGKSIEKIVEEISKERNK